MYKNNGEYSDHHKIYGKGYYDGLKNGSSYDGFGTGALVGGILAGLGGLVIGALSTRSDNYAPPPVESRRHADYEDDFDDDGFDYDYFDDDDFDDDEDYDDDDDFDF
jgi:hypothetical protein